ncbi:hypothetical protein PISMIDRAFT_676546 [Pisolithus microcarpus 441]|uniref:Uncharacterized protein n=1 Tax=Pisolithus microcarpus 441 TaxID=765257 RepID=A0A0C9Z9Z0_9AGAM|nr:hypothetical protein PISMIDRAFT_676546 [Pisolithus microcarpus 441]
MVKACSSLSAEIVFVLRKTSGSLPLKSQDECWEPRLFGFSPQMLKCHATLFHSSDTRRNIYH